MADGEMAGEEEIEVKLCGVRKLLINGCWRGEMKRRRLEVMVLAEDIVIEEEVKMWLNVLWMLAGRCGCDIMSWVGAGDVTAV